jgi:hypothetical protein
VIFVIKMAGVRVTHVPASVDLYSRRYRVKTEICSNVELQIREDRPLQRCVEAQLRGLDNGIITVICLRRFSVKSLAAKFDLIGK